MKILRVAFLLLFNYLDSLPKLYNVTPYFFVIARLKIVENESDISSEYQIIRLCSSR